MTILEVLLALALLSAVTIAAFTWVGIAAGVADRVERTLAWDSAADALLSMMHDDLVTADLGGSGIAGRVAVGESEVLIQTRAGESADPAVAEVQHRYWFEPLAGAVWLEERPIGDRGLAVSGAGSARLLLGATTGMRCDLDSATGRLSVQLTGLGEHTRSRRFVAP